MVPLLKLLFSFFPGYVIALELAALYRLTLAPSLVNFAVVLLLPYLLPLLTFRIMDAITPLRPGSAILVKEKYHFWLFSLWIQSIYAMFPFLEKALMAVPGLYSLWLRAWGSKIGSAVFWNANVEVLDRSMLEIGNRVFFGNHAYLSPHVLKMKSDRAILLLEPIKIGHGVVVGGFCRLGPGVEVADGVTLVHSTDYFNREKITKDSIPSKR